MMKILVPTDLSDLSKVAVHYAIKISEVLQAEIILLNILHIDSSNAQVAVKSSQIIEAMHLRATQDFSKFTEQVEQEIKHKIKISYKIIEGDPLEDAVEAFSKENDIKLIIMGTKGAGGLKKILMGSNATAIIGRSSIPVITVPENARFSPIKNIVYASDFQALEEELETLMDFARQFNSAIHLLHILPPGSTNETSRVNTLKDKYPSIHVYMAKSDNMEEAIDEYIARIQADLLVTFTHDLNFFEKLFGKSITRELAFHSRIPLLSLKKGNAKSFN